VEVKVTIGQMISAKILEHRKLYGTPFKPTSTLPSIYMNELSSYHKMMGERVRKQLKRS